MLLLTLAAAADPSSSPPTTVPDAAAPTGSDQGFVSSLVDVVEAVAHNLGNNGYQTGTALIVATVAVVAMVNLRTHIAVVATVAVGAFWAGWLGWNTVTGQNNPLFPGDVESNKLWDVAFTSDTGFLLVVAVACVAAVFLWRKGTALTSRLWLLVGAVLGASFLFNLFEAVRQS